MVVLSDVNHDAPAATHLASRSESARLGSGPPGRRACRPARPLPQQQQQPPLPLPAAGSHHRAPPGTTYPCDCECAHVHACVHERAPISSALGCVHMNPLSRFRPRQARGIIMQAYEPGSFLSPLWVLRGQLLLQQRPQPGLHRGQPRERHQGRCCSLRSSVRRRRRHPRLAAGAA